ncbi:MAG: amidohydrolase family protein [Phycisphaerales bacterium]|nr:amidohydrolase family protein [Phycisphaerales bacterium]
MLLSLVALLLLAPDIVPAPRVEAPTAITNLTIIPEPGARIEGGVILIRDGRITAVGPADAVSVPDDAYAIDGTGLVAYAGFIDGFSRTGVSAPRLTASEERRVGDDFEPMGEGPRAAIEAANRNGIFARRRVEDVLDLTVSTFDDHRRAGFTAALLAPPQAVLGGRAAIVQLGSNPLRRSVLRTDALHTASFAPPGRHSERERGRWPATTFGVMAHWRQVMLDAQWRRELLAFAEKHPGAAIEIPQDADLDALRGVLAATTALAWEADDQDEILRALSLSGEFGIRPVLVGVREAYHCIPQLRAAGAPCIVKLRFPSKPAEFKSDFSSHFPADADDASAFGRNWGKRHFQPAGAYAAAKALRDAELRNALALEEAGLPWALTSDGQKPDQFLKSLRELIEAGVSEDMALRALTLSPARILGVQDQLGSISPGKRANLTLFTRSLADKTGRVRWVFVDGRMFEFDTPPRDRSRRGRDAAEQPTAPDADKPDAETAEAEAPVAEGSKAEEEADAAATRPAPTTSTASATRPAQPGDDVRLHVPDWPIETEADRDPGFRTGGSVLLKRAYVITMEGEDLPAADILVTDGKIARVGVDLTAAEGVRVIDLSGYAVMPGVVDPHSHIALDSVNEWSQSVTCEVRCADVVRSFDANVFRAVAGGCTTIHAMHGSANTIGGQNVLLKLRHGRTAAEMILHDVPRTVKFATGENVTRPGRPQRVPQDCHCEPPIRRFPATRMGVETTMRRALEAGRQYGLARADRAAALQRGDTLPPLRRDLRLEALADIVAGRIEINCHCYRADEILRLLAVAEDFGVRVSNLHHCLEAYRIMPEVLRHGAGTCTFSDWWAYKVEAFEAVPHNAGMLLRAGINSTIKSDSADLMRHMPLEAAKCMKYSGLTADEALRMITINAARQFGLEDRLGSIAVGKDADLAVYNGHPLDTFSRCVLTLIDGEVYFRHRDFDAAKPAPGLPIRRFEPEPAVAAAAKSGNIAAAAGLRPDLASLRHIADSASGAYFITNAHLHPVSGPAIPSGSLLIRDGRIVAVGREVDRPADAVVVDAAGRHVYPGLINAACIVGLHEIDMVDVGVDEAECGTYHPDLVAASAFHPHSAMVRVTRADGVLTVHVVPQGPLVAGQSSLMDLEGWTADEMLRSASIGLVVRIPSLPEEPLLERDRRREFEGESEDEEKPREAETRAAQAELRRFFRDARHYAFAVRSGRTPAVTDQRFDALVPYALGERPVLFEANGYRQILEALLFAEQAQLRPVILGGRDAWKCTDLLARRDVPVIYNAVFSLPSGVPGVPRASEAWDSSYRAMAVMHAAGVRFCLANRDAALAKQLPTDAGFAVAHGLPAEAALRAMTLSAAEILGVEDRLGSLDPGKDANIVIATDHPAQAVSRVDAIFIRGKPVDLQTAHTINAERFAARPSAELPPERSDLRGRKSQSRNPAAAPGR